MRKLINGNTKRHQSKWMHIYDVECCFDRDDRDDCDDRDDFDDYVDKHAIFWQFYDLINELLNKNLAL